MAANRIKGITIALVAAAIGPVLIVIGKIMSAVGTIMTIVPKLAGVIGVVQKAFMALNATTLANPIVLIIAAIPVKKREGRYCFHVSYERIHSLKRSRK